MKNILISGLVNTETTCQVRGFPINYYPIDYPFFGVNTAVSGVAYNLAKAMTTLGDRVRLLSMTGDDFAARYIREELSGLGIDTAPIKPCLAQTPSSVVLYDETGRRQIYCDLKDIQDASYGFTQADVENADIVAACNINFNRPLLALAKQMGKTIATDVHVLRDIYDEYNRDFLEAADILFLSDEGAGEDHYGFIQAIEDAYHTPIIVMGRGSRG
ncbi:MAG: carbohydrate kinase family protein, partial [Oscillospiraceae bacterium]|nr:carbohydrate kinase family protein [Oscillospiraceae bacterium]